MRRKLKIAFWGISIISIALPLISAIVAYTTDDKDSFLTELSSFATTATTMLSGLCAVATLYIAILLYDRYGVEEKTNSRSIEAINALITDLQKLKFFINFKSAATSESFIMLNIKSSQQRIDEYMSAECLSSVLYYRQSAIYACSRFVEKNLDNAYLPKPIADALKAFDVCVYTEVNIHKNTRPLTTISALSPAINAGAGEFDGDNCYSPEPELSVVRFLDSYFTIKQSIIDWYKTNDIDLNKLNINQ